MEAKKSLTNYKLIGYSPSWSEKQYKIYTDIMISMLAKLKIKHDEEPTISILHVNK